MLLLAPSGGGSRGRYPSDHGGATDPKKGVMAWDESSSSFVADNASERQRRGSGSLVIHAMVPPPLAEGDERWRFEAVGA